MVSNAARSPHTSEFDRDTAVERVADRWRATVSDRWDVGTNPNGGYVLALLLRAMRAAVDLPDPLTGHRALPAPVGPR